MGMNPVLPGLEIKKCTEAIWKMATKDGFGYYSLTCEEVLVLEEWLVQVEKRARNCCGGSTTVMMAVVSVYLQADERQVGICALLTIAIVIVAWIWIRSWPVMLTWTLY